MAPGNIAPADPQDGAGREKIELVCSICTGTDGQVVKFSDISHLLTHMDSKTHLQTHHQLKVRGCGDPAARAKVKTFDEWHTEHNIYKLLHERLIVKDARRSGRESQTPAPGAPRRKRKFKEDIDGEDLSIFKVEPVDDQDQGLPFGHGHGSRHDDADDSDNTGYELGSTTMQDSAVPLDPNDPFLPITAKGIQYPGMFAYDGGTEEQKKQRNQPKTQAVIDKMQAESEAILPEEWLFSAGANGGIGTLIRKCGVYDLPDETDIPVENNQGIDHSTPRVKRVKRAPRTTRARTTKANDKSSRTISSTLPTRSSERIRKRDMKVEPIDDGEDEEDMNQEEETKDHDQAHPSTTQSSRLINRPYAHNSPLGPHGVSRRNPRGSYGTARGGRANSAVYRGGRTPLHGQAANTSMGLMTPLPQSVRKPEGSGMYPRQHGQSSYVEPRAAGTAVPSRFGTSSLGPGGGYGAQSSEYQQPSGHQQPSFQQYSGYPSSYGRTYGNGYGAAGGQGSHGGHYGSSYGGGGYSGYGQSDAYSQSTDYQQTTEDQQPSGYNDTSNQAVYSTQNQQGQSQTSTYPPVPAVNFSSYQSSYQSAYQPVYQPQNQQTGMGPMLTVGYNDEGEAENQSFSAENRSYSTENQTFEGNTIPDLFSPYQPENP